MAFDSSLERKLAERRHAAQQAVNDGTKVEGLTLFGKSYRFEPVMPASWLIKLGELDAGEVGVSQLLNIMAGCVVDDDKPGFLVALASAQVDNDFIQDYLEYVAEYYSARPLDDSETSLTPTPTTDSTLKQGTTPSLPPVVLH